MNRCLGGASTLVLAMSFLGCEASTRTQGTARHEQEGQSLRSYFKADEGIDTAGVRLVPIQTPKGPFKVWTKRFGHNPRIRVLLLHGGPGATHRHANDTLAKGMDPAVVKEIRELEKKGQYESPRYMELLLPNFYAKHICRLEEWPDGLMRAFNKLNKQVYVTMQGPSEFGASGRIEKWDRKADLGRITVPTLVVGAAHDTMDPEHMRWVSTQVKNGSFLLCPNGSHMAMWDDQRTYVSGLVRFLKAVDEGKAPVTF